MMIAVSKKNHTFELIAKSKIFVVNILGKGQIEIGKHFGKQSGREVNKFLNINYDTRKTGAPILKNCIPFLDCLVVNSIPIGNHILFIGEVVEANNFSDEETIILDRRDFFEEEL